MAYVLGDIFIGSYPLSLPFGARPDVYSVRHAIKGHNGVDFDCPSMTPVLSTADGAVIKATFDAGGYGHELTILHEGYLTKYAHLNDITVKVGDRVVTGQLVAHSNNSGVSDRPHLHFAVAPCDTIGAKSESDNGFRGYIDPMGERCQWVIKNIEAPVAPIDIVDPPIPVPAGELSLKTMAANSFLSIIQFAKNNGCDIDPVDPDAGQKVNNWIAGILKNSVIVQNIIEKPCEASDRNNPGQTISTQQVKRVFGPPRFLREIGAMIPAFFRKLRGFIFVTN